MNKKLKYLFANMGWMTISSFASKILVFLLVPFYTRVLTTKEYGLYDVAFTAVTLLAPLLTANVSEAVMRYSLADGENPEEALTNGITYVAFGVLLASVIAIISSALTSVFGYTLYVKLSCFMAICLLLNSFFGQFARGVEQVKYMALGSLINAVALVLLSVVFLLGLEIGVVGYFLATSLSALFSSVYIIIRCKVWRYYSASKRSWAYMRRMFGYGMPLSINTLGWWANGALGRYIVLAFCGLSGAGLLAAAYKIPAIPKTLQQIFIQAWQISSIKDYDKHDSDGFFSKTYTSMCVISSSLASFSTSILPVICLFAFSTEFYDAWIYIPVLMLSVVFNCQASIIGAVFSAAGNSKPVATSSLVSIVCALAIAFIAVPLAGVQGATISSMVSSLVIWLMRLVQVKPYMELRINWKSDLSCMVVLSIQTILAIMVPLSWRWYIPQALCSIYFLIRFLKIAKRLTPNVVGRFGKWRGGAAS